MLITDWVIKELDDSREVSALIDGFRLWYRFPKSFSFSRTGDPFLAAALLPAMLRGEPLQMGPGMTVSPKLLKNLPVLQNIHRCWNPVFRVVPVEAHPKPVEPLNPGAMSFFSGGVDSTYTFIKHREDISHLVFIQGFDFFSGAGEGPSFSAEDISDLAQLSYKLDVGADLLSAFIKDRLSETARASLTRYRESGSGASPLEEALAADLQKIIAGRTIYQERRFAGVRLRPETRQLLAQGPDGESLAKLNRRLLEDAYPLEIARRDSTIYGTAVARNWGFARDSGKVLIPVATNHFAFGYRYNLSRNLSQGGALASVALLLGFPRAFVPSSYSYSQLFPLGSHPLTDPLWSVEGTEIIHDGSEARRVDKIQRIAENGPALANLRVCFNDMNVNCGHCLKCVRTMIPLKLLQAGPGPFPPLPSNKVIAKMRIAGAIEMSFFQDNLDLARQSGDAGLRGALQACMKRQKRMDLLKDFDRVILGGLFKKTYRMRSRSASKFYRIGTTASHD